MWPVVPPQVPSVLTVSPVEVAVVVDDEATDEVVVPEVTEEVVVQEPNADWHPVPQ